MKNPMLIGQTLDGKLIRPNGIIHVGAGRGSEAQLYREHGVRRVVWIEALPDVAEDLRQHVARFDFECSTVICATISDVDGQHVPLYRAGAVNRSGRNPQNERDFAWSSLLPLNGSPELLARYSPLRVVACKNTVQTTTQTLATCLTAHAIDRANYDYLVLDLQGAELQALAGMGPYLDPIRYIQCEISTLEVYVGQPLRQEVERYLATLGFHYQPMYAWEAWVPRAHYLYVRRDVAQFASP